MRHRHRARWLDQALPIVQGIVILAAALGAVLLSFLSP
jgi:hypothetical protein